jgi:hypothetical protein
MKICIQMSIICFKSSMGIIKWRSKILDGIILEWVCLFSCLHGQFGAIWTKCSYNAMNLTWCYVHTNGIQMQ